MIKLEANGIKVKGSFHGRGKEILLEALRLEWTLRKTLKKNDLAAYMVFCDAVNDPDFLDSMETGSERNKSESKKEKFEDLFKKLMEELDEEA
ncbi:MAG: hypothetical protein PUB12_11465 [[Clostridium] aminophilum]|uniref:hypothetical protein n=1 Tax=[Clostridium] aminophilum TaxID=1526 RepID=UPI0026EEFF30|nr:hypothetical protein [[Clostridium] aminophilum]MDD6197472.1 hypothetical protein [[Clostridium] aminophilum]